MRRTRKGEGELILIVLAGVAILAVGCGLLFGLPAYNVWASGMSGEAKLRHSEQEKRIMIETAKARAESAILAAEAEVETAKLRSKAIGLVGQAAKDFPEYRTQEFIGAFGDAVQSGAINQIIYVPTEANIPIVDKAR